MVNEGRARLFKRKDGKFLIYLPKDFCEDSMFPFKNWQKGGKTEEESSIYLKVSFKMGGKPELLLQEWKEPPVTQQSTS